MPISADFTSLLQQDWDINFLQCYPNGYLKYTDLCNLFQLTAGLHAERGGISFTDMQVHQQAWVLSRMRVEINRLPKWRDKVTVKTWIHSLEHSRSIRCLEVYLGDEKLVGCETFWAVFNTTTRRPESLALPHDHFEKFDIRATVHPVQKIDFQHAMTLVSEHSVRLSDLDIVNHANSVKYLEWCLDNIDPSVIEGQHISSFDMNYLKEVSLYDAVAIKQHEGEHSHIFSVERDAKTCFALQLHLQ